MNDDELHASFYDSERYKLTDAERYGERLDMTRHRFHEGEACLICDRPISQGEQTPDPIYDGRDGSARFAHRACMVREVLGGIGHHIAHDYWCVDRGDPDAGLDRWQSAQLVELYVRLVGVRTALEHRQR